MPALLALVAAGVVHAQTLFQPAADSPPHAQGWSYASTTGAANWSATADHLALDTGPLPAEVAGWARLAPIPLHRDPGFTLTFRLRIAAEEHTRPNRAGCSVLVVCHDLRAIELAFWADRIWAQSDAPLFTQGEETLRDTGAAAEYRLAIDGDRYALTADGVPVLSGPLRDYTPFVGLLDPYETPDFLFLGDNTGSAWARFELGAVHLAPAAPPVLHAAADPAGIRLSWSAGPEWRLESSATEDGGPAWSPVSDAGMSEDGNGTRRAVLPSTGPGRLFRLRRGESPQGAGISRGTR